MWLFMGRWLTNLGTATDLLLAVNKLEREDKLNYDDPAVGFDFSQALQTLCDCNSCRPQEPT